MKTLNQDLVRTIVAFLSFLVLPAFGAPRGPLPPLPEAPPPFHRLRFDEVYLFSTNRPASVATAYGTVGESFSGMRSIERAARCVAGLVRG